MEKSVILSGFVPIEVWYEVLKRLPTKSLIRFRCVSKSWNSLIRTPNFIAAHHAAAAAAAAGNTHLFVQIRKHYLSFGGFVKHLLMDLKPLESGLNFFRPSKSTIPAFVFILSYAGGVVLGSVPLGYEVRHVLCNPCIHRYVVLPEPVSRKCRYQLGLGFVPSKDDIGVVKIIHDSRDVENGGSRYIFPPIVKVCYARERVWKTIAADLASTYLLSNLPDQKCCTNGRVHWVVHFRYENSRCVPCDRDHLLVFDFENERFETLDFSGELVKDLKPKPCGMKLLLFKQNLSVLSHGSQKCSLWSLMEYPDVSSWAKMWSFDTEMEVLYSFVVGWREDCKLIVSREEDVEDFEDDVRTMRVYDLDVGSSRELPFEGESAEYVCGFNESLFLSGEEMEALPLSQIQPAFPI